jgi:hypothetical protein
MQVIINSKPIIYTCHLHLVTVLWLERQGKVIMWVVRWIYSLHVYLRPVLGFWRRVAVADHSTSWPRDLVGEEVSVLKVPLLEWEVSKSSEDHCIWFAQTARLPNSDLIEDLNGVAMARWQNGWSGPDVRCLRGCREVAAGQSIESAFIV